MKRTWQERANNRTARLRQAVPLFAAQVEPVTPMQMILASLRHAAAFHETCGELRARGDQARAALAQIVTAEELAELDARRSALPSGPEYHADFYRRHLEARQR